MVSCFRRGEFITFIGGAASCPVAALGHRRNEEIEGMQEVRLEGLTLRVESVQRSLEFYGDKLGFSVEIDKAPQFAMIRVGGPQGGTIGLLVHDAGSSSMTSQQRAGIHIELTTEWPAGLHPVWMTPA